MLTLQILPPDSKVKAVINNPKAPIAPQTITLPVFAVIVVLKQHAVTATVSPELIPVTIHNGTFILGANKVFIDET